MMLHRPMMQPAYDVLFLITLIANETFVILFLVTDN